MIGRCRVRITFFTSLLLPASSYKALFSGQEVPEIVETRSWALRFVGPKLPRLLPIEYISAFYRERVMVGQSRLEIRKLGSGREEGGVWIMTVGDCRGVFRCEPMRQAM